MTAQLFFYQSLTPDQQSTLHNIYQNISFRKFEREAVEKRLDHFTDRKIVDSLIAKYSYFYFAKFELPDLLQEFDKVIWMDVDMLVRGPLDDMWEFDDFCWRSITKGAAEKQDATFQSFKPEIKHTDYVSPNGGLIGINRNALQKGDVTTERLYHWFETFHTRSKGVHGDEFAFFMLAANCSANVKILPLAYNCPSATVGAQTAKIIHAIGKDKFWNKNSLKLAYPDWWLWHDEWVRRGGEASPQKLAKGGLFTETPNAIVYSARFQKTWVDLFETVRDDLPDSITPDIRVHRAFWQLFARGWPKEFLHAEITKNDKDFSVAVHLERDAAKSPTLVSAVASRMKFFPEFERNDFAWGKCWSCTADHEGLAEKVLRCAHSISGLPYNKGA